MLLIGLTLGGAVLGAAVGGVVVAPRIIARQQVAAAHADSAAEGGAGHEGEAPNHGEGEREGGGEKRLVELANIIVNPAGSQGSRFLMTSVAIAVTDEAVQKKLNDRQVELRDRITTILETQTMAQLTAPGARDSLKLRIAATVSAVVGAKVPFQVFLPQFVIQ
jgi:flagellar FliL protein